MSKPNTYRVRAPFLVNSRWIWLTWSESASAGNAHAAIIAKGQEIGATGWDFGQADYEHVSRAGF